MAKSIDHHRESGSVEAMFRGLCERAASRAPRQFVAVEAFTGSQETMLSFHKGDIITASRNQQHIDWWFGYCKGEIGWFPTHCVQSKSATLSHKKHVLIHDNQNTALPSSVERPLQGKRPEINKLMDRVKQATRDGARTALLAVVGTEDNANTLASQHAKPTKHPTATVATNNNTNKSSPGVVSKQNKTTLQLVMEQEYYASNVELPTRSATVSPTRQVRLYNLQTTLPANLQQRREQLWIPENYDQQTVSSSSSSSSGFGREIIQMVAPVRPTTKIVGMEVSY